MKAVLICLTLLAFVSFSGGVLSHQQNIVFINPGSEYSDQTGQFWSDVNRFVEAAAEDLDVKVTTLFAQRNHLLMKRLAHQVNQYQPSAVIIVNEKGVGVELVKAISEYNIAIFTLLNGFNDNELATLTAKQRALIIGSLVPNNTRAGYSLMRDIHQRHQQQHPQKAKLNALLLRGDYSSHAALERYKGAREYLQNTSIDTIDNPVANWSALEAYHKVKGILQRTEIDMIWAANDPMAYGAAKAVAEAGLKGKVSLGGINWDKPEQGFELDVSYGGHVTLGAKALVMLKDREQGWLEDCEMFRVLDIFKPRTKSDFAAFQQNTGNGKLGEFDFKRFSKGSKEQAEFNLDTFITGQYVKVEAADSGC